jgi:peroxiredoxin
VELQENLDAFKENGIRICAISYDPVEVLKDFSNKHGISYPLLSDTQSEVIRKFGILNTLVPEDHNWYGVPFPGTYITDKNGNVTETSFYANHGVRDSIPRMISQALKIDPEGRVVQQLETDSLHATAELTSGTTRRGQVQTFLLQIRPKQGRHLHAKPLPEGYDLPPLMCPHPELGCGC